MASVRWTQEGLTDLARLDAWRVSEGWQPIALELVEAIEGSFRRWEPPKFLPGRPVEPEDGLTDVRMLTVTLRSKPFRVYFRFLPGSKAFEVLRVFHPRSQ